MLYIVEHKTEKFEDFINSVLQLWFSICFFQINNIIKVFSHHSLSSIVYFLSKSIMSEGDEFRYFLSFPFFYFLCWNLWLFIFCNLTAIFSVFNIVSCGWLLGTASCGAGLLCVSFDHFIEYFHAKPRIQLGIFWEILFVYWDHYLIGSNFGSLFLILFHDKIFMAEITLTSKKVILNKA